MPAIAEKYDIDFEEATTVESQPRIHRRAAASRVSSPERWNQMQSLVEHFGDAAVAEPRTRLRPQRRDVTPDVVPEEEVPVRPRRAIRHQPFRLTLAAVIMWGTLAALTLLLLGLNGATLALSQRDASVAKQMKVSQEAIDNANKSIASIQVSPQMAQWALSHGWHMADQADFDEVPAASEAPVDGSGAP